MRGDRSAHQDDARLDELAQLKRRNMERCLLYETIRDLTSTLSVREVLDRLMGRALTHLDAEIGSILLLGPDAQLRIVAASYFEVRTAKERVALAGERLYCAKQAGRNRVEAGAG